MTRSRLLLTGVLTLGTLFVPAAAAMGSPKLASPACTDSWKAPTSGLWSDAGNWTAGVPVKQAPSRPASRSRHLHRDAGPVVHRYRRPNHQFAAITSLASALLADRGADPGRPRAEQPQRQQTSRSTRRA